jgi:hypothetical protein
MTGTLAFLLDHALSPSVGNPLYRVVDEHVPALVAAALVAPGFWWVRRRARRGAPWASELARGYRALPATLRFTTWMLALSAAVHAGLAVGHPASGFTVLYLLAAAVMVAVVRRLFTGRPWRFRAALVLTTSILAYSITRWTGDPPDEVGLATKLVELAALAVVLTPEPGRRFRRLAGSAGVVSLVAVTGVSAWVGAFVAASGAGGGHHGSVPMLGTVVRHMEEREPTPAERAAADRFYAKAVAALAKYRDVAKAAADGYEVEGIAGTDFHAGNPSRSGDGKIFDPARPESLVYAETRRGPVLLGAVYEMPSLDQPGPAIGGPLTPWHGHENVCISIIPPALSGLVSPFGGCPVGSVTIPETPEMIHVWVIPGVPTRFGDLDEGWRQRYLASLNA